MIEKIARKIVKRPLLILMIAVVLSVLSVFGYLATGVNYDNLSYLPKNIDATKGIQILENPFHMAATSMLIVEDMPEGYTNDLVEKIKEVPGVSNVLWISNILGIQFPKDMLPDSIKKVFFSDTGTMVVIQFENGTASDETTAAVQTIRGLCNDHCYLSGMAPLNYDLMDMIIHQIPLFIGVAVILAFIAMIITTEAYALPVILMLNMGIGVVFNFGTNFFFGQISYLTQSVAAALQLGVTMDYSVFLYERYKEESKKTDDKKEAMTQAVVQAFTSLAGSSLTTIAGFIALCFMRFTLGLDMGVVMAKGVLLGIFTVLTVLPSLILVFDGWIDKTRHKSLLPDFRSFCLWVMRHRVVFILVFIIAFVPAYFAQRNVKMYYKVSDALPDSLQSKIADAKLKKDFDMSSQHFIVLSDQIDDISMEKVESEIKQIPGVTGVISYHSLAGSNIPDFFIPDDVKAMLKQGGYQLIMVTSSTTTLTEPMTDELNRLEEIVKPIDPGAYVTGEPAMYEQMIHISSEDFETTNYISIAAIFLIVAIAFKSLTVPILLVATIEFAIFLNMGLSFITGTAISFMAPTVISCIQLGATVDYAILMTSRFREELQLGSSREKAILVALNTSMPSIITSSLVLFSATLGIYIITEIDIVSGMCMLIARGALISAIVCIFILPSLLYVFEPIIRKTTKTWVPVKEDNYAEEVD